MKTLKVKRKNKIYEVILDDEWYEMLIGLKFWVSKNGYVCHSAGGRLDKQNIYLHRLIMNVGKNDNVQVDHINKNKLDNRVSNLRLCNQTQNNANINSKGVTYRPRYKKKWEMRIRIDGKTVSERYVNKDEAIERYQELHRKHHGAFSPYFVRDYEPAS